MSTIIILYDNHVFDRELKTEWGFSALIAYQDKALLFDTGGSGPTLLGNMGRLGIEPTKIDTIVLSHKHNDHTGGLSELLSKGTNPTIYIPPSFSRAFQKKLKQKTPVVRGSPGQKILADVFTTGEMGVDIPEQALVIQTHRGLVIITGCAHPGIANVIGKAQTLLDQPVHLVLGGFHLRDYSSSRMTNLLADFRRLGVEKVAPSHCTGKFAISKLAQEYGEDFIQSGAGKVFQLEMG